jgi:hypothetical protein
MTVEAEQEAQLPLDGAGACLVRARDAAGMTRTQVAAVTRIPERHLAAIEEGNYAALPARTYAVGFSRSYAKAVGADEVAIVAAVREELAGLTHDLTARAVPAFEPGDPARVPGSRLAWLAAFLAILVIFAVFAFWRSYYAPGGSLPSILSEETPAPAPSARPTVAPSVPAQAGAVVFTATSPDIWVKFYDGAGNQLLQKVLALGESWTVPADVADVRLWTARPEALAITIGGKPVPPLATEQHMVKDVPVTAAALLARPASGTAGASGQSHSAPHSVAPLASPAPAVTGGPAPAAAASVAPAAVAAPANPAADR